MRNISRRDAGRVLLAGSASLLAAKARISSMTEGASTNTPKLELWYRQPAREWTEALPVGNGRLAGMVMGGTEQERIQLNEETLWTAGPYDPNTSGGPEALAEIRRLVFEGKYLQAHDLFGRTMMGHPTDQMCYQPLGNLWLIFPGHASVADYRRALDMDEAIVRVTYRVGGVQFVREVLSSPVDQVIVVRLTASKPGSISLRARISGGKRTDYIDIGDIYPGDEYYTSDSVPPDGLVLRGHNASSQGVKGQLDYQARVKAIAEGGPTSGTPQHRWTAPHGGPSRSEAHVFAAICGSTTCSTVVVSSCRRYYPILKASAQFFLDTLVEHPKYKWLVTCPSTSPENFPKREGSERYLDETTGMSIPGTTICAGSTIDIQILRDLFGHCAEASELLGVDPDFRDRVREASRRLPPMQVGKRGNLQEWLEDWDDIEPHHRHLSHLWGLYPGNQISLRETPKLAAAAQQSIVMRGDGGMSFSLAWKVNLWARLLDAEHAHLLLKKLLGKAMFPNLFSRDGKALQVDGNLGGAAGIAEMLLQSQGAELHLLPALPTAWPAGSVSGLCARGGFEVGIAWENGKLARASIRSKLGRECQLRTPSRVQVTLGGRTVEVSMPEPGVVRFSTQLGSKYNVEAI